MVKTRASRGLGLRDTQISPGSAEIEMRVRDDMLNGFAICHGGLITLPADSAFAFACNAYNELTVASSLNIDFIAPVRGGGMLSARATEVSLSGRLTQHEPAEFLGPVIQPQRIGHAFVCGPHGFNDAAGYVLTCQSHPLTERVVISFNER